MRTLLITAVAFTVAAFAEPAAGRVTLDASTMEALEREDPARFRRLDQIVRLASERGCASAPAFLTAQFDLAYARCEPMLFMTSNPPKRRLTFKLDDTIYDVDLTV